MTRSREMATHHASLARGIIYAAIAAFVFATVGVLTKVATAELPVPMVTFFRQLFSLVFLSPILFVSIRRRGWEVLTTQRPWMHIVRVIASLGSMYCLFFAIKLIPLADAILLAYTRPLFLPIVIWIMLRKRITLPVWAGLALGFIGVALILKPEAARMEIGSLAGLASGLFGSVAILLIRRLGKTEPPIRIMAYYFVLSVCATAIPLPFTWQAPTASMWGVLVAVGGVSVVYQFFLTFAYRHARATLVSSTLYLAVVFTLIWDWAFWGQIPDIWSFGGIVLVCLGAVLAILLGRSRAAPGEQPALRRNQTGQ